MSDEYPARFPTTHWTLVGRAGLEPGAEQQAALNNLLQRYMPALKAHVTARWQLESHDIDDLLQGFVENKILERQLVSTADQQRGRFRGLLTRALSNYIANQLQKRGALKRAHERVESLDAEQHEHAASEQATTTDAFDLEWARQVLEETTKRMKTECREKERDDLWEVFNQRVLTPIVTGAEPISYDEMMEKFGYQSPTQASNSQVTAKRMFARILRDVVSEYALDDADIETELVELRQALAGLAS